MGRISNYNLNYERELARIHINSDGLLPSGNEAGGHFWDVIRTKYDHAIDTGHEHRFEHFHPVITPWLQLDDLHRHMMPIVGPLPPSPPLEGQPGDGGTVPEPGSGLLLGVGMLAIWIIWRIIRIENHGTIGGV